MTNIVTIQGNVVWRFCQTKSGTVIADCDPLNLVLETESVDELKTMIPEAMGLLFLDLYEDGAFNEFLHAHGWSASIAGPGRPSFTMPFRMEPNAEHTAP